MGIRSRLTLRRVVDKHGRKTRRWMRDGKQRPSGVGKTPPAPRPTVQPVTPSTLWEGFPKKGKVAAGKPTKIPLTELLPGDRIVDVRGREWVITHVEVSKHVIKCLRRSVRDGTTRVGFFPTSGLIEVFRPQ